MKQSVKYKEVRLDDLPDSEASVDPPSRKVHIDYKKLVVPSRMRSSYWRYFGFPAGEDGKMITKDIIVCVLCKSQMVYNRNTSNLKMHLGSRHKNALMAVECESGDGESVGAAAPAGGGKIKSYGSFLRGDVAADISNIEIIDYPRRSAGDFKNEQLGDDEDDEPMIISEDVYEAAAGGGDVSDIAVIFPSNEEMQQYELAKCPESAEVNDAILNFLITDLVPPKIVEGKGFHNFISVLSNKTLVIPNERKITEEIIPDLYRRYKDQVYTAILSTSALQQNISLSMEQWSTCDGAAAAGISKNSLRLLSVYVHYSLPEEPSILRSKLLKTVPCTGYETVEQWSRWLDSFFNEWNLQIASISAVLVAFHDQPHLREALKIRNLLLVPCFLHLMQNFCLEHCFRHPDVHEILEKCRALIGYLLEYKEIVDLTEDVDSFVDADGDENDFVVACDQPHISWLTTYYMLRGILRRKKSIVDFLSSRPAASASSFDSPLTVDDWKTVLQLLKCLEPLKTVILTLFEEKTSLISLIKPLIDQVCSNKFAVNYHDSSLVKELKNDIMAALEVAYSDEDVEDFILVATKLDPRFKTFLLDDKGGNESDAAAGDEHKLVNLLNSLIDEQGLCSSSNGGDASSANSTKKHGRPSGINVLFGSVRADEGKVRKELSNEDVVKMEISTYRSESSALLEECPLEWWQGMKKKCPNLLKLVRRYHCVPAVTMLGNLFNLKEYITFCSQRASLPLHIADSLLFLNMNK